MKAFLKSRVAIISVLTALTTSLLISGCSFLPAEEEILQPPLMQQEKIEFKTEPAARGDLISQLKLLATFYPQVKKSLSFESQGGRLKNIAVSLSKEVKAGDLIAELNSNDLDLNIKLLKIDIQKTKLTIGQLQANDSDTYSIKRAQLDLQQQELRLDNMESQLSKTRIYAPIDGKITHVISLAIGEYISAFQTVAIISDTRKLVVMTSAVEANRLPIGAKVIVEYASKRLDGEVVANPSTLFSDPDESIRKSAFITLDAGVPEGANMGDETKIIYVVDHRENVIKLPRSYINSMSGYSYVNVLEDGVRVEKDVQVGLTTATEVEIISGLNEGDLVIVN